MKVGDYVRTKDGLIGKYNIKKEYHTIPMWQGGSKYQEVEQQYINDIKYNRFDYEIIKSSPNIIDLIEVGDYVNGHKVLDIAQAPKALYLNDISQKGALIPVCNYQIKSIVTREMFESMEYRIGD